MPGHRGYVFSRPFMGERAPQHVQNIVIRDYCRRHGLDYLLSASEYAMAGSFLMLRALLAELPALDGIVAYSLFQMPEDAAERAAVFDAVLAAGKSLHFAVEGLALRDGADRERIETIWKLAAALPHCPQSL